MFRVADSLNSKEAHEEARIRIAFEWQPVQENASLTQSKVILYKENVDVAVAVLKKKAKLRPHLVRAAMTRRLELKT